MDRVVLFWFGHETLEVYLDDVPEDATPRELKDMAIDTFLMNSHYEIIDPKEA